MVKQKILLLALGLSAYSPSHAEAAFQPLESIYSFAKDTIEKNAGISGEYEINVLPLDNELKLAPCTKPLETLKTTSLLKTGRVSIGVHCSGEKKWSIFVSAVIKAYEYVIVLTRPVQRGGIITRQDLAIQKMDVSNARGDFVTRFEQVENKEAARNLPNGAILGSRNVSEPPLIKRKDNVMISSGQSSFSVQMSGTALMDGAKGQVIKIKNESSGRVVSGTVVEAGVVLVK
jgi:flagellar basal body P-ring formation protein FlgA